MDGKERPVTHVHDEQKRTRRPGPVIVKSSQVMGLRDRVAIIRALLQTISSPHPYAGYGDLIAWMPHYLT